MIEIDRLSQLRRSGEPIERQLCLQALQGPQCSAALILRFYCQAGSFRAVQRWSFPVN